MKDGEVDGESEVDEVGKGGNVGGDDGGWTSRRAVEQAAARSGLSSTDA